MDRSVLMAIVIVFLLLMLLLLWLGWRARKKRQRDIPSPSAAPADLGESYGDFDGYYVATTRSEDPLDRIAIGGLGFRAHATMTVASRGLAIGIPGSDSPFIPVADARDLRDATWTIDRVVEDRGMQVVGWTLGDTAVDSYFRMTDPAGFAAAVRRMLSLDIEQPAEQDHP